MDIEFVIAMLLSFVVAVVVIRTVGEVWTRHLRLKERQLEVQAAGFANNDPEQSAKSDRLEKRVQVLERLATDRGQDLAREIEDLRSERELAR